jgi:hypothetical protein
MYPTNIQNLKYKYFVFRATQKLQNLILFEDLNHYTQIYKFVIFV